MHTIKKSAIVELTRRLGSAARLEHSVPLAPYTTFKIGGPADYLFRARSGEELVAALTAVRELEIPHFLLGLGANILVGDRGFRGVVIESEQRGIEFLEGNRVRAAAGEIIFP